MSAVGCGPLVRTRQQRPTGATLLITLGTRLPDLLAGQGSMEIRDQISGARWRPTPSTARCRVEASCSAAARLKLPAVLPLSCVALTGRGTVSAMAHPTASNKSVEMRCWPRLSTRAGTSAERAAVVASAMTCPNSRTRSAAALTGVGLTCLNGGSRARLHRGAPTVREMKMSTASWPSTPLDAAEKAFTLLAEAPTHVPFDARGFDGLPDRIIPLDELRRLLLSATVSSAVRDAVWRELVIRARRDGPAWRVACVGTAMPGLRRQAGMLAAGWHGDTHDLDSELLVGFMERLATIDYDEPRICGRLVEAGVRAARKIREAESGTIQIRTGEAGAVLPIRPWDHPDLVLARAVAVAVLDRDEATLIASTRLDHQTLARVAAQIGISPQTASAWRARAEKRLVQAIGAGELSFVPLRTRRHRTNTSRRTPGVGPVLGSGAAA
jgi:hypothetical protein